MKIAERLKYARTKKEVTQVEVQQSTSIHAKTLSGYENGVSEPDLETIKKLAKFYNVTVDWLLDDNDSNYPGKEPFYIDLNEYEPVNSEAIILINGEPLTKKELDYILVGVSTIRSMG
ncbi:helix-turn-helix domain-containing protein [Paenibacillus sp. PR3]|uniref:Helix-turn-helix domain-containing protein n=1 Tax=Paenibacillus terricola TaxID=2763503 RepID=A0ABR8N0T3_9BACL|nr:helix-turn-helix transcriptional regulator [Paenibacillus terricola]MBD3920947.1 helix-turn-helix domain-containing protein [Paenibacillus terricola]